MAMRPYPLFGTSSFVVRVLLACLLVFGTYNPSGTSYLHWLFGDSGDSLLLRITVGVALLFVYRMVVMISWRALGNSGVVILLVLLLLVWYSLWRWTAADGWIVQTSLLGVVAAFFGIGLSYSGILYRLSRQVQSADISQPTI